MFIAALFATAKTWKQPECPSTDDWIKKCIIIHNGIIIGFKKNKEILLSVTI